MICPRCGENGHVVQKTVSGKQYYYCAHYVRGQKKKRYCYLGPAGSYFYVNKIFGDSSLDLTNIEDTDWLFVAKRAIENITKKAEKKGEKESAMEKLRELKSFIELKLNELECEDEL